MHIAGCHKWKGAKLLGFGKKDSLDAKLTVTYLGRSNSEVFRWGNLVGIGLSIFVSTSLISCSKPVEEIRSTKSSADKAKLGTTLTYDLGSIPTNYTANHTFTIHNNTDFDWTYRRIDVPCSCTVPKHANPVIKAGGTGEISVAYRSGTDVYDVERSLFVFFKEEGSPLITLKLLAKIRDKITILPNSIDIYCSSKEEQISHFDIYNYSGISLSNPRIDSDLKKTYFEVSQVPISQQVGAGSVQSIEGNGRLGITQVWRAVVDARNEEAENQEIVSRIMLNFASEGNENVRYSRSISLRIRNRGMIHAAPSSMFFGSVKVNETREFRIMIKGLRLNEIEEKEVTIRHDLGGDFNFGFEKQDTNTWILKAKLKSLKKQLITGTATIDLGPKLHAVLRIPVVARIE